MTIIKYTEIGIYPENKEPVVEFGSIQGEMNVVLKCFETYLTALDRRKQSYCYKYYKDGTFINYRYNLKNSEFESFKKYLPDFK